MISVIDREGEQSILKKIKNKTVIILLLSATWIWEFFTNIWYTAKCFLVEGINSDYAGDAVFAKHLADSGKYIFSTDWYPTTELYVIHHQIIMTPLFKVFKNYKSTWIATSVIAFLLMSASIYYFMRILDSSMIRSILAVVLFMNPIMTFQMSFSVWFHGYLFYYLLAFVLVGTLLKNYSCERAVSRRDVAIALIFSFLAGLCGIRMFMIVFIPLLLTIFIDSYDKEIGILHNAFIKLVLCCFIIAIVGFAVYSVLLVPMYANGSLLGIGVSLNSAQDVNRNILSIPQTLIDGLNINFSRTKSVFYAGVIFAELLLWGVIFINNITLLRKNNQDSRTRLIALFALVCATANIAFMVLTQSNEEMLYRYRYFSVSTFVQIPLFTMTVEFSSPIRVKDCFNCGVIIVSVLAIFFWEFDNVRNYGREPVSWRQTYIDFLVENGYTFGISTYWNANTTIFASNGQIQVAPVNNDDDYTFFEWNTQRSFKNRTPEFVLLEVDEYEQRDADLHPHNILYRDDRVIILEY